MDEHFPISVQFLQRPFNRIVEEEDLFEERDAFPVPVKPYFKGSNDIPDDVPTREIRKQVAAILGFKQGSEETYLGNTHNSVRYCIIHASTSILLHQIGAETQ